MNVTGNEYTDSQLHNEGYLHKVSAEQREYAEASAHLRIAENNDIITRFRTDIISSLGYMSMTCYYEKTVKN